MMARRCPGPDRRDRRRPGEDRQAALALATQFGIPRQAELPRVVSAIYAGERATGQVLRTDRNRRRRRYSVNQGQIIESVLLSILPERGA